MKVATFKALLNRKKSVPYTLILASGDRINVTHRETIKMDEVGELVAIRVGDGRALFVDLSSIVGFAIPPFPAQP